MVLQGYGNIQELVGRPNIKTYGAVGDGVTDDTAAFLAGLSANQVVFVPQGDYLITDTLPIKDGQFLIGAGMRSEGDNTGSARLLFQSATGVPCWEAADGETSFNHAGMRHLTMLVSSEYSWVFDLKTLSGIKLFDMRMKVTSAGTGGFRASKINSSDNSWVLAMDSVEFRLPDDNTARVLDIDVSDSHFLGCTFTGGKGIITRGAGQNRFVGGRQDRSSGYGITINKENEAAGINMISAMEIEENALGGILVNVDADDYLTSDKCMFTILGNGFRNHAAPADIVLVNETGDVIHGGSIVGNAFTPATSTVPIIYDHERWKGIAISGNAQITGINQHNTYVGTNFLPSPLLLAQSAEAVTHTGSIAETTLATITVPANAMGANGRLIIKTLWTTSASTNNKNTRVYFGATKFTSIPINSASNITARYETEIANRGAVNSQIGGAENYYGFSQATVPVVTSAIDTSTDVDVTIKTALANAGDSVTLESYSVLLYRGEG